MSEREHLISDDYRALQAELHKNPDYGSASVLFAPIVSKICEQYGVQEILDYGAGKGRLAQHLRTKRPIRMTMYDPVMPQWSARPEPAEMVACVDVLEHIEPEKLENVLDDLRRCVKRVGFFSVSTVAAEKILSDGRNAHLIIEPPSWWLPKIQSRWDLQFFQRVEGGFFVIVTALAPRA
jgi:hypothetical protein